MSQLESLSLPARGALRYLHLGHCSFAVSDGEALLLIDPFLSGQFTWKNQVESHLDKPALAVGQIAALDAILVSHEHGDHFDPVTLQALIARHPRVKVYAPTPVVREAVAGGLPADRLVAIDVGQKLNFGSMEVTIYPAAASEQVKPVDRVGFEIAACGRRLFHQGDAHGYSPAWAPMKGRLDGFIMWPWRVLEVAVLVEPKAIVFQHLDRFEPGNFFCNRNAELELTYHRHYHRNVAIHLPNKGQWEDVAALASLSRG